LASARAGPVDAQPRPAPQPSRNRASSPRPSLRQPQRPHRRRSAQPHHPTGHALTRRPGKRRAAPNSSMPTSITKTAATSTGRPQGWLPCGCQKVGHQRRRRCFSEPGHARYDSQPGADMREQMGSTRLLRTALNRCGRCRPALNGARWPARPHIRAGQRVAASTFTQLRSTVLNLLQRSPILPDDETASTSPVTGRPAHDLSLGSSRGAERDHR
jgi:hypothetical protein